jgi:nucleoside-diphosphate-sugar epimerase
MLLPMTGNCLFCFGLGYTAPYLARRLQERGWAISGTCRSAAKAAALAADGITAHLFARDCPLPAAALDGVTHVLLSVPPDETGDPVLDTMGPAIAALPDLAWLGYLSTTGVYGDRGGAWVDENAELRPSGERGRRRVMAEAGWLALHQERALPVHVFRLAGIYGPGRSVFDQLRAGTARRLDRPGQVFSRIHVEDLAFMLDASIANPRPGAIYNLCDDEPAAPAEVVAEGARLLGLPPPPLVPFAEAALSPLARSFWDDNKRVDNRRIKQELGVQLRCPDYRSGLSAILAAEGALPKSAASGTFGRKATGGNDMPAYNVLILGASYGSLLATKLLFGGHKITMICLPAEIEAFNGEGAVVRLPVRGRKEPVVLNSRRLPGSLKAAGPGDVNPADFDLVALAMQEPQYRSPGVRELLDAVARAKKPCMSIMNMPPLPYLKRISGLDTDALRGCFTDATVWDNFEPGLVTLCSPDPQAIRPPGEKINVLQVTLPTNFKVARFDSDPYTAILRQMEKDIDAARFNPGEGEIELPVKLRVHDSIFVPLAKWAMLLTGNYRCVKPDRAVDIKDAVHRDMAASRGVYNWVRDLCVRLGAAPDDLVPFEKYAAAANDLVRPSSAARALFNGAPNIERTDRLVQSIGAQFGLRNATVDETVATVDARIAQNRKAAAA